MLDSKRRLCRAAACAGVALALWGCGEATRDGGNGSASGGGAGASGGGASAVAGNTESASGTPSGGSPAGHGGGDSSAAGTGDGGAGGGEPFEPCGGELTGAWTATDARVVAPRPADVNECWNLHIERSGQRYVGGTQYPTPEQRTTHLIFRSDGSYQNASLASGPVVLEYAPACLVTEQGTPTCEELELALYESGLGEGAYRDTMCSERAGGGCTCSVHVELVGGSNGSWVMDTESRTVTFNRPEGYPEPRELSVGYCVTGAGLRFDAAIEAWFRGIAGETLRAVDCTDGARGPGEDGVDCGLICPNRCP